MDCHDVIIIGAGPSGLAAGIRLSQYGKSVRIIERQHYVGGLNSYYHRGTRSYDVGLHAMTNLAAPTDHKAPLNTLLRQLKIRRDAFDLCPQSRSCVRFPEHALWFDNDFETLRESVREAFPKSIDDFDQLVEIIRQTDAFNASTGYVSARQILSSVLSDCQLTEMLLCPMMFYGSAWRGDMDFNQFCILFRSIFLEGLFRPTDGMERFWSLFTNRLKENGVELSLGTAVRRFVMRNGLVSAVVLSDGSELPAKQVLSCAGYPETMSLLPSSPLRVPAQGALAYVETLFEIGCLPAELGMKESIEFGCGQSHFDYNPPRDRNADLSSHVLCVPGNFIGMRETGGVSLVRLSHLANVERWRQFDREAYRQAKEDLMDEQQALLERRCPGFVSNVVRREMFSPLTVERYAGRVGGAIYGSPDKTKNGLTSVPNLYVCGADQGYLGIIGALMSGVVIANRHLLK